MCVLYFSLSFCFYKIDPTVVLFCHRKGSRRVLRPGILDTESFELAGGPQKKASGWRERRRGLYLGTMSETKDKVGVVACVESLNTASSPLSPYHPF